MSVKLNFEEPPEHILATAGRGMPGRYVEFAVALRDHQDKWAVLPTPDNATRTEKGAKATAQNIRRGKVKGFTAGEYQAVTDGHKVWVRYVGAAEPSSGAGDTDDDADDEGARRSMAPLIRQWAMEQGLNIPERGRLPREIVDAYWDEHGGRPPSPVRMVK